MLKAVKTIMLFVAAVVIMGGVAMLLPIIPVAAEPENADIVMQLSPVKKHQKLEPGQKFEGSFNIYNLGAKAFDFRVYVKPLTVGADCTDQYNASSDYTQMTGWTTFEQLNFYDLQPGDYQTVKFVVDVPKTAPEGGQYVVIFAEISSSNPNGETAIQVHKRVGYKLYADLGGKNVKSGEVESVQQNQLFLQPPIESTSKIRNNGNVDFTAIDTYTVEGIDGKKMYIDVQEVDVLPDTCRIIDHEWEETPTFGLFKVSTKIEFLDKTQFEETKWVLVVPVWFVFVMSVVVSLLIGVLVMRIKERRSGVLTSKK